MASTLTIANPQLLKIKNAGTTPVTFVPYRENAVYTVDAGKTIELEAATAGQALYYLKQALGDLTVEQIEEFDAASADITVIDLPATVTIKNGGEKDLAFVPYRENFGEVIKAGDTIILPASTVGQVLYYLNLGRYGFTVSQEAEKVIGG